VSAELADPTLYIGNLTGSVTEDFNPSTGQVIFNSLSFDAIGQYFVTFHVTSDPPDYNFTYDADVRVLSPNHASLVAEETPRMQLKFDADYDSIVGSDSAYFGALVTNYYANMFQNVSIGDVTVERGTVIYCIKHMDIVYIWIKKCI
jgi:hypothetical protein